MPPVDSKTQLRSNRRHALNAWLLAHHLRMDECHYWAHEARAEEEVKFAELDAVYEHAKSLLQVQLLRMTVAEQSDWFSSVGWTPVGATKGERTQDYLDRA